MKARSPNRRFTVSVILVILLSFLLPAIKAYAEEPPRIAWVSQFGTTVQDQVTAISVDSGGVYVAGYTDGGVLPGQTGAGIWDAIVRKYDASGNEIWTRQFGTSSYDMARAISVDSSGIYVAGQTFGAFPGETWAGWYDVFVRKYDVNGHEVWTRQFGSSGQDYPYAISTDSSGVYVAGTTQYVLPDQTSAGSNDAFVRKYDVNGNEVWTRQFGTAGSDNVRGIAADSGGVYVAGSVGGVGGTGFDAFVRKYDVNGNEVWTRQFGTTGGAGAGGIVADSSGVYVEGYTAGAFPSGGSDVFVRIVRKYDAGGNEVWTRQVGPSWPNYVTGIAGDSSGVYVAGYTYGTLTGQANAGGWDIFARKYDASGNEVWTRQFGTTGDDYTYGISADSGGVYVGGKTIGTFSGQTNAGDGDAFVVKLAGVDSPPVLATIGNKEVDEGQLLTFTISATDPDGDLLIYSASGLPSGATFNAGSRAFSWTPGYTQAGSYQLSFTVSDGSLTDSETVTVSVNNVATPRKVVNLPPGLQMMTQDGVSDLSQVGQTGDTTALLQDSQGRGVGRLLLRFSQASADIDLSNLVAQTDLTSGKAVLHRPGGYPAGVGQRDLYVPKLAGHNQVRVCNSATTLAEVTGACPTVLRAGQSGLTTATVAGQEYWVVLNVMGTGAQGEQGAPEPTATSAPASQGSSSSVRTAPDPSPWGMVAVGLVIMGGLTLWSLRPGRKEETGG